MIILRNDSGKIVELFDTVKEFKNYLDIELMKMEEGMAEDGLLEDSNDMLFGADLDEVCFEAKLEEYLTVNTETIEIK